MLPKCPLYFACVLFLHGLLCSQSALEHVAWYMKRGVRFISLLPHIPHILLCLFFSLSLSLSQHFTLPVECAKRNRTIMDDIMSKVTGKPVPSLVSLSF